MTGRKSKREVELASKVLAPRVPLSTPLPMVVTRSVHTSTVADQGSGLEILLDAESVVKARANHERLTAMMGRGGREDGSTWKGRLTHHRPVGGTARYVGSSSSPDVDFAVWRRGGRSLAIEQRER